MGRASIGGGTAKAAFALAHLHMLALMLGADFCCVFLNSNAKKLRGALWNRKCISSLRFGLYAAGSSQEVVTLTRS